MLRSKTLLLFLVKALIIYGVLAAPFDFYDKAYGDFYRKIADKTFGKFRETGFVRFSPTEKPAMTHTNIGNVTLALPDGSFDTVAYQINTRILGYLPTILLIALVLASPVPWKRKGIALLIGLPLVMGLILFKHWISLLYQCDQNPWVKLTDFSGTGKTIFDFTNTFISTSSFTVPYFVVGIWLMVTFRLEDLKTSVAKIKK
jgi:hypothetical protein